MTRAVTGYDPGAFAPVESAPGLSGRPVFFFHGARDPRINPMQTLALWRAVGAKDPLWIVAGAKHNEAWRLAREHYEASVTAFFAHALLGEGEGIPEGPWDSDGEVAAELLRRPRAKGERD